MGIIRLALEDRTLLETPLGAVDVSPPAFHVAEIVKIDDHHPVIADLPVQPDTGLEESGSLVEITGEAR